MDNAKILIIGEIKLSHEPHTELFENGVSVLESAYLDDENRKRFVRIYSHRIRYVSRSDEWRDKFRIVSVPKARDESGKIVIEWLVPGIDEDKVLGDLLDQLVGNNPANIRISDDVWYLDYKGDIIHSEFEYSEIMIRLRSLGNLFKSYDDAKYAQYEFNKMYRRVTRNIYIAKRVDTSRFVDQDQNDQDDE